VLQRAQQVIGDCRAQDKAELVPNRPDGLKAGRVAARWDVAALRRRRVKAVTIFGRGKRHQRGCGAASKPHRYGIGTRGESHGDFQGLLSLS
jgi:hypothetical protein